MLNPLHSLERLNIRTDSVLSAIQDTRNMITSDVNVVEKAKVVIENILGIPADIDNKHVYLDHYVVIVAQHIVQTVVNAKGEIKDPLIALDLAKIYADKYIANPNNQFHFAKVETVDTSVNKAVVKGIDTKVAVRRDGKIKKGGKQVLAAELYKKYVLESSTPLDNQGFIAVVMKELDMSKAGATTYAYNCKKQLGVK